MSDKRSKVPEKLHRIRVVYSIFAAITIIGLVLYFANIFTTEQFHNSERVIKDGEIGIVITDLVSGDDLHNQKFELHSSVDSLQLTAHVHHFDVEVIGDAAAYNKVDHNRTLWAVVFQVMRSVCFLCIIVLTLWFIVSFYLNLKKGHAFPSKNFTLVTIIGIVGVISLLKRLAGNTRYAFSKNKD